MYRLISLYICLFPIIGHQVLFSQKLKRPVPLKERITSVPQLGEYNSIIIKIAETQETNRFNYDIQRDITLLKDIKRCIQQHKYLISSLISQPKEYLFQLKLKGERQTEIKLANLSLYYKIKVETSDTKELLRMANEILNIEKIETAYFPFTYTDASLPLTETIVKPTSIMASPDFSSKQFYLDAPPQGINASYAWAQAGGDGSGIYFADIESGIYYPSQEDIMHSKTLSTSLYIPNQTKHCTAVFGEILAAHNNIGVNGIAPMVDSSFHSDIYDDKDKTIENVANAMLRNAKYLRAGDVFLIEMQCRNSSVPNYLYMPVEYGPAEFDVIQTMVANGITVVQAGGNGGKNLDDTKLYGQAFDTSYKYSGALIIGCVNSGIQGGNSPARSKHNWSSYGKRIDFYSYGEMIATTGYGDLYGSSVDDYYTAIFGGTSGASPVIAGSAIVLQSIFKTQTGKVLTPLQIRNLLKINGTPSNNPSVDKVGTMPNLKDAVDQLLVMAGTSSKNKNNDRLFISSTGDYGKFRITCPGDKNIPDVIATYDIAGKLVWEGICTDTNCIIDLSSLQRGVYVIKQGLWAGKIIVD